MNTSKIKIGLLVTALAAAGMASHAREPDITIRIKVGSEYRAVLNEGTDREYDSGWLPNMILDQGLNYLGVAATAGPTVFCSVGTSSTAVSASQTALGAHLASTSSLSGSSQSNLGASLYQGQVTQTWSFTQGAVVGNITEMGIGRITGGAELFSRCLIIDGGGTPVALTVVALDQLTVYYRVTATPVLTDLTSSVVISSVTYNFTARLANATQFAASLNAMLVGSIGAPHLGTHLVNATTTYPSTSTIGAITSTPSGTSTSITGSSTSTATYTNGNFYNDSTLTVIPSVGNSSGGIGAILINFGYGGAGSASFAQFQYVFTTPIPKDNTKTLTLVTRFAWSR